MRLDEFQGVNAAYVLELYERFRQDPGSVDPDTRRAFETWSPPSAGTAAASLPAPGARDTGTDISHDIAKIVGAANLADCIRRYGHLAARIDPLGSEPIGDPSLSPAAHGITDEDLKRLPASLVDGPVAESSASAFEAIERLRRVYCSTTGFDYAHVFVPEERDWLRHAAESGRFLPPVDAASAAAVLDRLSQVEAFERFLHRTFPGKTRFSVEGLDMLVPILDEIICGVGRRRHAVRAARHGAPRPAQRPGPRARQAVRGDPRRVQGSDRGRHVSHRPGLDRRRQVPRGRAHGRAARADVRHAGAESQPPRSRRSRGGRAWRGPPAPRRTAGARRASTAGSRCRSSFTATRRFPGRAWSRKR